MKNILTLLLTLVLLQSTAQTDLDKFVQEKVNSLNIAGASVLVTQQGKTLLSKGYGFADLSHDVKTTPETTYFLVGPGGFILSASVMQLAEQGKLSLDDELSKYLPDFPLQGRKITIRHLITSTSGIIDYHYLGDPLESTYRTPKASDEVKALFSGRPYTTDAPGSKWDWSISNFALLVEILEQVSGMSYPEYLRKNVITPLGLKSTRYIEEKIIIKNLARGYGKLGEDLYPTYQSMITYDPSLRISISTGDLLAIWNGIKNNKLVSAKSYSAMTTPEGAARQISTVDPTLQFGYIVRIKKVGDQTVIGLHGALPGYSSHCYYFKEKDISIVVLANTSNQYANEIGEAIGLKLLGLPATPARTVSKFDLADQAVPADEQKKFTGTFIWKLAPDPARHRSYDFYRRTLRVFIEQGRLKLQRLGDTPEPLLRQGDGTFAVSSSPGQRWSFGEEKISVSEGGKAVAECERVGEADVKTFHGTGLTRE
jgi:D-alanyl-D-alanine carboxypeptidase